MVKSPGLNHGEQGLPPCFLKKAEKGSTRENTITIETDIQRAIPIWVLFKISKEEYDEKYLTNTTIFSDGIDKLELDNEKSSNKA